MLFALAEATTQVMQRLSGVGRQVHHVFNGVFQLGNRCIIWG